MTPNGKDATANGVTMAGGKAKQIAKITVTFTPFSGEEETLTLDLSGNTQVDAETDAVEAAEAKVTKARGEWTGLQNEAAGLEEKIRVAIETGNAKELAAAKESQRDLPLSILSAELVFRVARVELLRVQGRAAQAALNKFRPQIIATEAALRGIQRALEEFRHRAGGTAFDVREVSQSIGDENRKIDALRARLGV